MHVVGAAVTLWVGSLSQGLTMLGCCVETMKHYLKIIGDDLCGDDSIAVASSVQQPSNAERQKGLMFYLQTIF